MGEQLDLSVAETRPSTTFYKVERLTIDVTAKTILVQLAGANGEAKSKVYDATTTPTGATLLSALNTSNNTATSLIKRVYNRLVSDGVLNGSVSGTAD